jgi:ribonuclease III
MAVRHPLAPLLKFGQMILKPRKFKALEAALGYKFKSEKLLERALTHASVRGNDAKRADNERLEFIGDRVLGLAIAEMLHTAHPDSSEGDTARRYNVLVRGEACARFARQLELGQYLIMSPSEVDNGGRDKENILADAIEAVLGAIFLDGGFLKARDVIGRVWGVEPGTQSAAVVVDPKSALQEWAQGRGLALPQYLALARTGPDHAPQFRTEVRVDTLAPAQGCGPSKRAAEQSAASAMLDAVKSNAALPAAKESERRG